MSKPERTINRWKNQQPEFCQSLKEGKAEADARVADSLSQRAIGDSHKAVKIFGAAESGEHHTVENPELARRICFILHQADPANQDEGASGSFTTVSSPITSAGKA